MYTVIHIFIYIYYTHHTPQKIISSLIFLISVEALPNRLCTWSFASSLHRDSVRGALRASGPGGGTWVALGMLHQEHQNQLHHSEHF